MKITVLRFFALVCVATILSACAETQLLVHTAKRIKQQQTTDTESKEYYKVGNPYQIKGAWYYPEVNYQYNETGIASWYGTQFHGKKTANGEIYNMNDLTAAHRTLPLPTWVEVTNLDNGRKIKLRINDRGPYAKGRIIDISRRGSQLLGFQMNGIAKVRVKVLAEESRQLAASLKAGASIEQFGSPITVDSLPKATVNSETLAPPPGANVADQPASSETQLVVSQPEVQPIAQETTEFPKGDIENVPFGETSIYVQAGSFTQYENALRAQAILSQIGETKIIQALVNGTDFFRVRIGPIANVEQADALLDGAIASGYPDSRILVD